MSVVAQRHFGSHISGSSHPPAPYMININTPNYLRFVCALSIDPIEEALTVTERATAPTRHCLVVGVQSAYKWPKNTAYKKL